MDCCGRGAERGWLSALRLPSPRERTLSTALQSPFWLLRLTRRLPCFSCAALWFGNQRVRDSCAEGSEGAEPNPEPCAEGDYTLFYAAAFLFGIMDCAIQVRSRCC